MAKTILELFKDRQSAFGPNRDLYGLNGTALIESRGIVNPKRLAALAVSSPNPVADIIGGQVNGFVGGNSNRPDDTIFKNNLPFSKPITLKAPTTALLRTAVEAGVPYFVKTEPAPFPGLAAGIVRAFSNPAAFVSIGSSLVQNFGSKKAINNLKKLFSKKGDAPGYGPKFLPTTGDTNPKKLNKDYVKYSTHYTLFTNTEYTDMHGNAVSNQWSRQKIQYAAERGNGSSMKNGVSPFDYINDKVLNTAAKTLSKDTDVETELIKELQNEIPGYTYVAIKLYGKSQVIVLPGTITGLSEDLAPEINSFKYVGSPFNLYRYGGVERTIKFDLKLYALDPKHELVLRTNLDSLRKLVYPDENIAAATYANDKAYSQLYFSPNLVELNIYGLYKNLLAIVDTMGISIDDNTPWASSYDYFDPDKNLLEASKPHPTIFNISLGFKIIERPNIYNEDGKYKYEYAKSGNVSRKYDNYFTGYSTNTNTKLGNNDLPDNEAIQQSVKGYTK